MSRFGTVTDSTNATVVFVESAQADDLQLRANKAILAIYTASPARAISAITLAGGGDGHTFVVLIESAPATDVDGGLVNPNGGCLCYLASENEALSIARAVSFAQLPADEPVIDEQLAGSAKGTRFMGLIVVGLAVAPTPPADVTALTQFGSFFALMPGDNASTIAIGGAVLFPQDGPGSGSIVRSSSSQFVLPAIGIYDVSFQVSVAEAGQLMLDLNGSIATTANTVAGRATGTSQIMNRVLLPTTVVNSVLRVINPAGNAAALTLTPTAGGTHAVSAWLTIRRAQ